MSTDMMGVNHVLLALPVFQPVFVKLRYRVRVRPFEEAVRR